MDDTKNPLDGWGKIPSANPGQQLPPTADPLDHSFYGSSSKTVQPPPAPVVSQSPTMQSTPPAPIEEPIISRPVSTPARIPEPSHIVPPPAVSTVTEPPLPPPPASMGFPFRKILTIAGVLLVLIILGFVGMKTILPLFGSKEVPDVTLTYWGLWEDERVMRPLFTEFTKNNPHIKVNYLKQDIKDYRQRLSTRIPQGNGPDIYRFHNTWLPMMSSLLVPFPKDTINTTEFKDMYFPVVQTDATSNGALYGVPLSIDTLVLFTNDEILQAAGQAVPKTWDEFITVAKATTVKDEAGKITTSGGAIGTYDNITHAPDLLSLILLQNGTDIRNLTATAKNATDALTFYTSFAKGDGSIWDSSLDPSQQAFAKGSVAMYFGYSWDVFTIKTLNPSLQFSTHSVPNLPGRNITVASYWIEGVSSKSTHQKEALALLTFLSKKETLQKFYTETAKTRLFGELYPRKDLADTLKDNTLLLPFIEGANNASSSFFVSDTYDKGLNDQMNAYLGNAVRSVLDATSPESAVETLSQGVFQVLSQYGQ